MPTTQTHLTHLEAAGLIRLAQQLPDLEYLFRHALIQDAAYLSLLHEERRRLHRAAGEVLEQFYQEQLLEQAATLGEHFARAGDGRALHYLTLAADNALANYANHEAESLYRRALPLAGSAASQAALLAGLGKAVFRQGQLAEAVAVWRNAIELYQTLGNDEQVARLYADLSNAVWLQGDNTLALTIAEEGLAALAGRPETAGLTALLCQLGTLNQSAGRIEDGFHFTSRSLTLARHLGDRGGQAQALIFLGYHWLNTNQYEAAGRTLAEAVALAQAAGLLSIEASARSYLGRIERDIHLNLPLARAHFLASADLCHRTGEAVDELFNLSLAGVLYLLTFDWSGLETTEARIQSLLPSLADPATTVWLYDVYQAYRLRILGSRTQAIEFLQAVRQQAEQGGEYQFWVVFGAELADLYLEGGCWQEAERILRQIQTKARSTSANFLFIPYLLSQLCSRQQRIEEGRYWLAEANQQKEFRPDIRTPIYRAQAEAYLAIAEGNCPAARAAFAAVQPMLHRLNSPWYQARLLLDWAQAYPHNPPRARQLIQEAISLLDTSQTAHYADLARQQLASIMEPDGKPATLLTVPT